MRLEDWRPERLPAQVVARALAPLPRLVEQTGFLLSGGAVLLAMKGRLAKEECEPLAGAYNIQPVELNVPGAETVRKLAIVRTKGQHSEPPYCPVPIRRGSEERR